ncbi:MAG: threonine synthase [Bacillota bacterium]
MSYAVAIKCTKCQAEFGLAPLNFCPQCGRPGEVHPDNWTLEVVYDLARLKEEYRREDLAREGNNLWRYRALLPIERPFETTLDEGGTPLVRAFNLARELGLGELYIKDETRNPTSSFKDRMVAVTISQARQFAKETILITSDGNLGAAGAAFAARYGLRCLIMTYPHITENKLYQMLSYGGRVFDVRGSLRERVDLFLRLAREFGWYIVNGDHFGHPLAVEGYKTIALEIAEQLAFTVPDKVIVPVGSGEGIAGIYKGFAELKELGWIPRLPQLVAAQVEGNDPLVRAAKARASAVEPLAAMAPTVVGGINTDVTGSTALAALYATGGFGVSVNDEEALDGMRTLAVREGIYTEPASGVAVAALKKLARAGEISPEERVVVVVTSSGLKDLQATKMSTGWPLCIGPKIESFLQALEISSVQ